MPSNKSNEGDLKKLLTEWKLENILSHLSAEHIDVEVLEMMEISHIRLLICNFSLGVQIRFEYNFERWRRSIGKPLNQAAKDRNPFIVRQQDVTIKSNTTNEFRIKPLSQSKITQTDLMILDTSSHANSEKTNDNFTCSDQNENSSSSKQTNKKSQLSTSSKKTDVSKSVNSTPVPIIPQEMLPKVDLQNVLTFAPYGVELTNKYRERNSFTYAERRQLISVIVKYYLDNGLQFNLHTSYAIEHAILKMFPNEKLEMYRTGKSGRIYAKYLSRSVDTRYGGLDKNEKSDRDYAGTGSDNCFGIDNFSDDSQMAQVCNTAVSHMDDDEDYDDAEMMDDDYTVDFIGEGAQSTTAVEGNKFDPVIKIEPENVSEAPPLKPALLSAGLIFKKKKPEDDDIPFDNFQVPWHKIPSDVLDILERKEKLGKRLNTLTNLLIDELRNHSTHIPMRVFRNVTQQLVTKYPHSFLDRDAEGNVIASFTVKLVGRLRSRNCFLNRPH